MPDQETMNCYDIEIGMLFDAPNDWPEQFRGKTFRVLKAADIERIPYVREKFYCTTDEPPYTNEVFVFDPIFPKSRFNFRLPEMTREELLSETKHWKLEAEVFERQMKINNDYAIRYESALDEIAKLCGWVPPTGSCIGVPEDVDDRALRLVKEKCQS